MRHCRKYVVALLVLAQAAAAQDRPLVGTWCSVDRTELLYIEPDGVAMNEHTICDVETEVGDGLEYQTALSCRNVYFIDDEPVEAFPETLKFKAVLSADEVLSVLMRDVSEPVLYKRC